MVEGVERFSPDDEADALAGDGERALEERRDVVNRPAPAGVAAHDDAVDHGTVSGGACVPAIGDARSVVVGQAGGKRGYAAEFDLERQDVEAAEDEAVALVKDRAGVFHF